MPQLRRLLDEMADFLDSDDGHIVLRECINQGFDILVNTKLAHTVFVESEPDKKARLANIMAVITRQAHLIAHGIPNDYLDAMERVPQLQGFSAIIYSSFARENLTIRPEDVSSS
ncbi:Peroxisomal biogenesis factor 3 [Neolecta irregularis DAH-3]|uniref:Peroxisomal biogenesis factor 3 n=1 Tax=Neolecta irregularis (strain DAH-3) TaxID=1198029 RepID=A0A1U7LMC9_NEOID|nr:Peroxisomal biogenesis factor 3 [Neolecta irregularis DAH-3]|eukprot:OLL23799.1 Peroxisomal biogenesis factor 3 [Neolecta irregularis DAH-3]